MCLLFLSRLFSVFLSDIQIISASESFLTKTIKVYFLYKSGNNSELDLSVHYELQKPDFPNSMSDILYNNLPTWYIEIKDSYLHIIDSEIFENILQAAKNMQLAGIYKVLKSRFDPVSGHKPKHS